MSGTHVAYQGQPAQGTTPSKLYTCNLDSNEPNGELIKEIILTNTTNANATITLYKVASAGSAVAANAIVYQKTIPAYDLVILALTTDMAVGDFVYGCQGTASAITVTITNYIK